MIEEMAIVAKIENGQVWVNPANKSACSACLQKTSCTSSILGNFFQPRLIAVDSSFPLMIGDKVMVATDEALLLHASLFLYLFPLLAMFVGAGLTEVFLHESVADTDFYIALAAIGSLGAALGLLHLLQKTWLLNYCVKAVVVKKVA